MLGGSYADGAGSAYIAYSLPLNSRGTRLTAGYDYSAIDINSGPHEDLNISGESTVASLYLSHRLRVNGVGLLSGLLGYNAKESITDFDSVETFNTQVRSFTAGVEYQHYGDGFVLYVSPRLTRGLERFGGDSQFTLFTTELQSLIGLSSGAELGIRARLQLEHADLLASSELFQLGGAVNVRGYPEDLLVADEGYFLSAEYSQTFLLSRINTSFGA